MSLETIKSGEKVHVRIGGRNFDGEVVSECDEAGLIQVRTSLAERIGGHQWKTLLFYAVGPRTGGAIIGVYTVHPLDELPETLEKSWEQVDREEREYNKLLGELERRLELAATEGFGIQASPSGQIKMGFLPYSDYQPGDEVEQPLRKDIHG